MAKVIVSSIGWQRRRSLTYHDLACLTIVSTSQSLLYYCCVSSLHGIIVLDSTYLGMSSWARAVVAPADKPVLRFQSPKKGLPLRLTCIIYVCPSTAVHTSAINFGGPLLVLWMKTFVAHLAGLDTTAGSTDCRNFVAGRGWHRRRRKAGWKLSLPASRPPSRSPRRPRL